MPISKMKSNVVLVGFMASGKTTIAKRLAESLNYQFIDTDQEIEKETGLTINEIFKTKGEKYFRELESNYLKEACLEGCVVATGGGMPCFNDNMKMLRSIGSVVYLNTPFNIIIERLKEQHDTRPLVDENINEGEISERYNLRISNYKNADIEVDGSGHQSEIISQIIKKLN